MLASGGRPKVATVMGKGGGHKRVAKKGLERAHIERRVASGLELDTSPSIFKIGSENSRRYSYRVYVPVGSYRYGGTGTSSTVLLLLQYSTRVLYRYSGSRVLWESWEITSY